MLDMTNNILAMSISNTSYYNHHMIFIHKYWTKLCIYVYGSESVTFFDTLLLTNIASCNIICYKTE